MTCPGWGGGGLFGIATRPLAGHTGPMKNLPALAFALSLCLSGCAPHRVAIYRDAAGVFQMENVSGKTLHDVRGTLTVESASVATAVEDVEKATLAPGEKLRFEKASVHDANWATLWGKSREGQLFARWILAPQAAPWIVPLIAP